MYCQELDVAKMILDEQVSRSKTSLGPLLNKNMPRVSGSLKWSQELRERVCSGMDKLKAMDNEYVFMHCT